MEHYEDTGEEGFVECLDTVSGEEEDTTIVLDVTETKKREEKDQKQLFMVPEFRGFFTYKTATKNWKVSTPGFNVVCTRAAKY